ncbi:hypothetical protein ABZX92_07385 [Lentzea sp. NPDC006480]|uniref:hypothetical protein n=1 Tax=Lentzea sp. NPDC006480 TaxID=3157176 RepID=UPI0033A615B2
MTTKERIMWLTITVLSSIITGLAGGILSRATDHGLVDAIVAGAVTFAGTEAMLLAILGFVLAQSPKGHS